MKFVRVKSTSTLITVVYKHERQYKNIAIVVLSPVHSFACFAYFLCSIHKYIHIRIFMRQFCIVSSSVSIVPLPNNHKRQFHAAFFLLVYMFLFLRFNLGALTPECVFFFVCFLVVFYLAPSLLYVYIETEKNYGDRKQITDALQSVDVRY